MNSFESYMNRVKGRLWMHMVGGTLMEDQQISWDDRQAKGLVNEQIRTHVFPFTSFSEFFRDGYRMLKDYYIALPPSQAYRFIGLLLRLWERNKQDSIRNAWTLAQDPTERQRVAAMDDDAYETYWKESFREHHRGIPRSRADFLRYAEMDERTLRHKLRKARHQCRERIGQLQRSFGFRTWIGFQCASWCNRFGKLFASSMVIALVAVTLAESLKMLVVRLFNLVW